jgi:hypothetical protein
MMRAFGLASLLTCSHSDEGEWHLNKKHGKGAFIYANGDKFEGIIFVLQLALCILFSVCYLYFHLYFFSLFLPSALCFFSFSPCACVSARVQINHLKRAKHTHTQSDCDLFRFVLFLRCCFIDCVCLFACVCFFFLDVLLI